MTGKSSSRLVFVFCPELLETQLLGAEVAACSFFFFLVSESQGRADLSPGTLGDIPAHQALLQLESRRLYFQG